MSSLFENILTASLHGSIVIAAVLILRLALRKAARKYICYLWLLAGLRLLMPFQIKSEFSLQPQSLSLPAISQRWQVVISVLWVSIALGFLIYSAVSYTKLRRRVKDAVKIPGGWESAGIDTAFILGFVKPKIYIPRGMAPATRKHILSHERTHLDKGDHWIKMIGFLALALHWFNPLVWVAYTLLCKDIEMACDERVVQFMELPERKEYSAALLSCASSGPHFAASPVAFGEVSVKSRIRSVLNYRKPGFWLGLLSVTAIGFVTVCLVTSPTAPPAAEAVSAPAQVQSVPETVPETQPVFTPAVQPPMEESSDWGFHMIADAHSPTTMTLYYGVGVEDIPWDGTPIYKDHPYWIETWNGESWEELPTLVQTPEYEGSYGIELSKDNFHGAYTSDELDWTLIYGALPEGDYRIVLRPTRNGTAQPHYAWFHIYTNALTGEEAEALERCETALSRVADQQSYKVTLSETNQLGYLMPKQTIIWSNAKTRIDSYTGSVCYNTQIADARHGILDQWDDDFRTKENKFYSFPEGESLISDREIRFAAQWTDVDGVEYTETLCYTFGENGNLASVDRLSVHMDESGNPVIQQKHLLVESVGRYDIMEEAVTPKDSFEASQDSPWGIFFRVDDDLLEATGGEVWMGTGDTVGVIDYTTDGRYWLEAKTGEGWQKLPTETEPSWGDETYRLSSRTTVIDWVDWSPYYGKLPAGVYRMGKHFYSGEESIIQYSEFYVAPDSEIVGEGGEEALARVNEAMERLRGRNYHIVVSNDPGYRGQLRTDEVYWKWNGVCVTDYYDYHRADGYRHSVCDTDPDDIFYDYWMWIANWQEGNWRSFFLERDSMIRDDCISFTGAPTNPNVSPYLVRYTFWFDENGDITSMEFGSDDGWSSRKTIFTVMDTPETEIQSWVETILAQQ